jgi:hypothetical protein
LVWEQEWDFLLNAGYYKGEKENMRDLPEFLKNFFFYLYVHTMFGSFLPPCPPPTPAWLKFGSKIKTTIK